MDGRAEIKGNVYLFLYSKSNIEMDDCQGGGDFHGKFVSPNAFFRHFLQNADRVADFLRREVDQRKKQGTIDATN